MSMNERIDNRVNAAITTRASIVPEEPIKVTADWPSDWAQEVIVDCSTPYVDPGDVPQSDYWQDSWDWGDSAGDPGAGVDVNWTWDYCYEDFWWCDSCW